MKIVRRDCIGSALRVLCAVVIFGRRAGVWIARGCGCAANLHAACVAVDVRRPDEAMSLAAVRDNDFDDIFDLYVRL